MSWSPQLGSSAEKRTSAQDCSPTLPLPPQLQLLQPSKQITSVSIRHGDLVDSITLGYGSGEQEQEQEQVRAGGTGGSSTRTLRVDVAGGERVMGFFGGTCL